MSDFEQLGGELKLRALIDSFVDRVFADQMIGFFFARADRQRIKDKEYEFAAVHLGATNVQYTGRPLPAAHGSHPIMGGHFMRRLQLLKETMAECEVSADIQERWIRHVEELQPVITASKGSECRDEGSLPQVRPAPVSLTRPLPLLGGAPRQHLGDKKVEKGEAS